MGGKLGNIIHSEFALAHIHHNLNTIIAVLSSLLFPAFLRYMDPSKYCANLPADHKSSTHNTKHQAMTPAEFQTFEFNLKISSKLQEIADVQLN